MKIKITKVTVLDDVLSEKKSVPSFLFLIRSIDGKVVLTLVMVCTQHTSHATFTC